MLENTGEWLLKKNEFRRWRSSTTSSILWLHGIRKTPYYSLLMVVQVLTYPVAGSGKTKLTWDIPTSLTVSPKRLNCQ